MEYNVAETISITKKWIEKVVIGCNFCPFAAQVFVNNSINYLVTTHDTVQKCAESLLAEFDFLNENTEIETSLIILLNYSHSFDDFLAVIENAEENILLHDYEGIYQIASFHPLYLFEGATETDAANYTNRSPFAMLHILREASIDKVLLKFKNPEKIPVDNILYAQQKGLAHMQQLKDDCM
jgi:uncharacterized protein